MPSSDLDDPVYPNGLAIRRLRHERGWSSRQCIDAIARASESATGIRTTITPNQLMGIEEHNEPVPYETLCLLSSAFDCDPIDLWSPPPPPDEEDELEGGL